VEDARAAMEKIGLLRPWDIFTDRQGDNIEAVEEFITWCTSLEAAEMRRVAGMQGVTMLSDNTDEWLTTLMQKQIRMGSDERFKGTVLDRSSAAESSLDVEGNAPESVMAALDPVSPKVKNEDEEADA